MITISRIEPKLFKFAKSIFAKMTSPGKPLTRESYTSYEREKYLRMSLVEKRLMYKNESYVTVDIIPSWREVDIVKGAPKSGEAPVENSGEQFTPDATLNSKIALWRGDITCLEFDAIVNAANKTLLGGGGVDGAIHHAAGPSLRAECQGLKGCETGVAKITGGYRLPAKYVIHTVGPQGEHPKELAACYRNSLDIAVKQGIRTIAFPCISTGAYGYPNDKACQVALSTVRKWLEENGSSLDRILFCVFLQPDFASYSKWLPIYFPK